MVNLKTIYRRVALAQKVLTVAVINYISGTNDLFDWAVYIDAVAGYSHKDEFMSVAENGDKAPKEIAITLYPYLDINKYRS